MTGLAHYINGKKVSEAAAEKALAKAEKDGKPVRYDTEITGTPDDAERALNAIRAKGDMTPGELADWLNGAREIYAGLPEVSTDKAKALLDKLHDDEQIVSVGGTRFKLKDG